MLNEELLLWGLLLPLAKLLWLGLSDDIVGGCNECAVDGTDDVDAVVDMTGADCLRGEDTGGGGGGGAAGELGPLSLRNALRAACIATDPLMASLTDE